MLGGDASGAKLGTKRRNTLRKPRKGYNLVIDVGALRPRAAYAIFDAVFNRRGLMMCPRYSMVSVQRLPF